MSAPMSKLEYLKKYMSSSKKEENKVKKKKLRPLLKAKGGIKIVDEEIDLRKIAAGYEKDEDQIDNQEDAPLVAGVVDNRSIEMITKQDFVESSKWKRLGVDENDKPKSMSKSSDRDIDSSDSHLPRKDSTALKRPITVKKERHDSDSDPSPPRRRHDSDSDASPPRRKRHDSDSDPSPLRRTRKDSDQSPPRKRHDSDSDASPPRRTRKDSDQSPLRRRKGSDSDQSPPRKHQNADGDLSPPRRKKNVDSGAQMRIKPDPDGDLSPERPNKSTSRSGGASEKLTKTLDGKMAGLQTGRALREETDALRKREEEAFRKMDKSLTGQNATTAIRAGKLRQIEAKQQVDKEKAEKIAKLQEAYQKWNKGLKQGETHSTQVAEAIHEMSKPLARFADDEDLERLLREQDREGDPMAAYMAKKKVKSGGDGKGKAARPVYRGPAAAPNRFGILPGYRWDGVDRSTGYEKMYFEKQNNAVALQEEAYKWSVSDM
ncbi:BUD13 homolog isoform X2 [Daphnia pulex]|uniref:BUD13 homolog isoform X2 n=1 Tax=Daphnia pulex TaxID=6669 RepID=UPI001EDD06A7|nr:BUD13 homolog isoform X2 [Daphnia pulex]